MAFRASRSTARRFHVDRHLARLGHRTGKFVEPRLVDTPNL
jgi:hypothetical protein